MFKYHWSYIQMALESVFAHKLRSFLSVLGITIGIFCIVMVFTAVSSLERHIKSSVESLGTDVLFIQKWPWNFGSDYPWWKYYRRPEPTFKDFEKLDNSVSKNLVSDGAFFTSLNSAVLKNQNLDLNEITILAISSRYNQVQELVIKEGRYFSPSDFDFGTNVAIIGYDIAENLGIDASNLGTEISVNRIPTKVVGILEKQGDNLLGKNNDQLVFTPYRFLNKSYNLSKQGNNPAILLKVNSKIPLEQAKIEVRGLMRSLSKLRASDDDNFAINQISMLTANLTVLFNGINVAGLLIGIFAVLVGGFGVANIMFVSVKERTNLIGIQKALGAKKKFIQNQFISESVILCLIGGLLGMLLVYLICLVSNHFLGNSDNTFRLILSLDILLYGVISSALIGVLAGYFPASQAAKMLPVDAIRNKG